jgi:hypothetical protein
MLQGLSTGNESLTVGVTMHEEGRIVAAKSVRSDLHFPSNAFGKLILRFIVFPFFGNTWITHRIVCGECGRRFTRRTFDRHRLVFKCPARGCRTLNRIPENVK